MLADDKWGAEIARIEEKIGPICNFTSKKAVRKAIDEEAVNDILDVKSRHSTMIAASQPTD